MTPVIILMMTLRHSARRGDCRSFLKKLIAAVTVTASVFHCVSACAAADPDTEDTSELFRRNVQPFLNEYCDRCHNAEITNSGIRIDELDAALPDRQLFLWRDILRQIDSGVMPPADEPQPDDSQRMQISDWIRRSLEFGAARDRGRHGSTRRMTVSQYRNTMRALLGLNENLSTLLPPDGVSKEGFLNNGQVLGISPLQMEYYIDIAERSLDLCIVDEHSSPVVQCVRVTTGRNVNPDPSPDALILGANSLLLANTDFVITQPVPEKPFAFTPYGMKTSFDFIEGYVGNDTVREWRHFDGIHHNVFACMRGTEGYPLGEAYQAVAGGILLRPAIPSPEIFGESNTYGPMANFKISLRELPDHGDFQVRVVASRYNDGLLLDSARTESRHIPGPDTIQLPVSSEHAQSVTISQEGIYRVDVSCRMSEPSHLLRLNIDDREFSVRIRKRPVPEDGSNEETSEQTHSVMVLRTGAGSLNVAVNRSEKTQVDRVFLTRLSEHDTLAEDFMAFEKRSPILGVHLGLRRDCGSTLNPVGTPQPVTGHEPETFIFEGAINDFPAPSVEDDNVNYLAGIREIGVRSEYTDGRSLPRLKIHSVEFEGPYYTEWPPRTHRSIFMESEQRQNPPAYAKEIIEQFSERAWRRPVNPGELDSVIQVWQSAWDETHDFNGSVREALLVVLTSPQFLFLIENSEGPEAEDLTDWELASKLSYFLWNGPPDELLLNAARQGTLHRQLIEQTDRMMSDPRFGNFLHEFASQWLSLDRFDVLEVDRDRFPALTRDTRVHLRREPEQFLGYLVNNNLPVGALVRSDFVVVNDVVASYYGFGDQSEHGFAFRPLNANAPRLGGVLTQAAILAGLSDGRESNPVKRGAWFARKIIAEPPDDPPPNVPELREDGEQRSLREKLERHRNQKGCVNCHRGIDPWGIAFEQYDASGRFRQTSGDPRSVLPDGVQVESLDELKDYLIRDRIDQVAFSVLKHLSCFASGRSLTFGEIERLKKESLQLKDSEYRMADLIRFVVAHDMFVKK